MQKQLLRLTIAALTVACLPGAGAEASKKPAFAVEVTGKGKPMILIPGLSSSGEVWNGTVAHFKDKYQCHVLTLAGFAGQPRIEGPFLETVRTELAAYIRSHKLGKPIIVGHSLGGFLALWLASSEPGLAGPLVIVDSLPFLPAVYNPAATPESSKPMAEQMRAGMAAGKEAFLKQSEVSVKSMVTKPEDVATVMGWATKTDPVAAGDAMYDMFTHDLRDDIASIDSPALVLGTWIAYKEYATREQVEANFKTQYAKLKNAKIMLADNARHFIMLDDPNWLMAQMDAFLAEPKTGSKAR